MVSENGQPESVARFGQAARRFCSWAEAEPADPRVELRTALQLTSDVYAAALHLPDAEPIVGVEDLSLSLDDWKSIYRRFGQLPIDNYSELFDQSKIPAEDAGVGSIADDLADVYRDLVQGVRLEDAGRPVEALWQWRMNFRIHWGRHASSALHVLHCYAETNHEW